MCFVFCQWTHAFAASKIHIPENLSIGIPTEHARAAMIHTNQSRGVIIGGSGVVLTKQCYNRPVKGILQCPKKLAPNEGLYIIETKTTTEISNKDRLRYF